MLHRIKQRSDIHFGKWNGLGGKFEPGEAPEDCVAREVREESGLEIAQPQLRGILTFPYFKSEQDWVVFVFTADMFSGELIQSAEGQLEWVDADRIQELNLWEGDRVFLNWINQELFFSGKFLYRNGVLVEHSVSFYPWVPTSER